jgi:hypothetical protein
MPMNTKASPASGRVWRAAALVLLALLAGCGDRMPSLQAWGQAAIELVQLFTRKPLPDPVQSKDGVAYIPIDDTAFLVPEETWLRGYSRNSTDGLVANIALHASVPDVQPWSPERNDAMYWKAGPGLSLRIDIQGNRAEVHLHFHEVPHSRQWKSQFIEEPSDQAAQGLRRFRRSWGIYPEKDAEKDTRQFGAEFVERMRGHNGKPMKDTVYYEYIQNDRVQYFIHCSDGEGLFHICHLSFPWARSLMVDIEFARRDIKNIVAMADKVSERLREFEAAGLAYQATQSQPQPVSPSSTR